MQVVIYDPSSSSELGVSTELRGPQILEWTKLDNQSRAKLLQRVATDGLVQLEFSRKEAKELQKQGLLNAPATDVILNSPRMFGVVTFPEKGPLLTQDLEPEKGPAVTFVAQWTGTSKFPGVSYIGTVGTVPLTKLTEFIEKFC